MGYPGPTSSAHEAIAKYSFIGALDSELAQKVRERDPSTLDEALHIALRLETIREAAAVSVHDVTDDHVRYKNRHARGINTGTDQSAISSVLPKMNEMQSRLDKDLKVIVDRRLMWKLRCSDLDNRKSIVSQRELGRPLI